MFQKAEHTMRIASCVCLVALLVLVQQCSATVLPLRSFDNFLTDQEVNSVITGPGLDVDLQWTWSTHSDATIPGGERDLALVATGGEENRFISGGVQNQAFWFQTTPDVMGYGLLQYDGKDHTTQLDGPTISGLGEMDLTMNGLADSMQFMLKSSVEDSVVFLSFFFYDSYGALSSKEYVRPFSNNGNEHLYNIMFADLHGGADLTKLGALEVVVNQFTECRVDMSAFSISRNTVDMHGDTCHSALPANLGVTTTMGTEGIVYENICGLDTSAPTTWFYVVPAADATAVFSTCGPSTNFDTVIAVIDNCDSLQCIAANDDSQCDGEDSSSSAVRVNVQQNHVYFIMVAGYGEESGLFSLDIYLG